MYARMARCDDPAGMDAQVDALLELAESKGFEVSRVFREVASGFGGEDDRPVLKTLLEDVEAGRYDAVIVRDVSRLSRAGSAETARIASALARSGTSLVVL